MGKFHKKRRNVGDDAPIAAPAPVSEPKHPQPSVVTAFPGPRSGFLLEHERGKGSGGGESPLPHADIAADSAYLTALISLIPPELYVPKSEEEKEATWSKYAKNKKGVMPKQELKEASKKAKKARYDLAAQTSVAALQARLESGSGAPADDMATAAPVAAKAPQALGSKHVNGVAKGSKPHKNGASVKRASSDELLPTVEQSLSFGVVKAKTSAVKSAQSVAVGGVPVVVEPTAASAAAAKSAKRKVSLTELLAKAERNQSRIDALKQQFVDVETGKAAPDEVWEASMKRVAGEKVKDNPALIRKSIRREKQKKMKSAKKWADRKAAVETGKAERQEKRQENLATRKDRGKKSHARAGFEGQKRKFLNEKSED